MKKVLLILSTLFTIATAVFAWVNRSNFIKTRADKDAQARDNESLIVSIDKNYISEINKVKTDWQASKKQWAADKFARDTEVKETKNLEEAKVTLDAKKDAAQKEIDTIAQNFNEALKGLGITKPEELTAKRDAMNAEVQALNEESSKLEKEIQVLNGILTENARQLAKQNEVQTQRSKAIALSNQEGVITAVNADFGFVIIGVGKAKGVSLESRLLAKRGIQLLGKLTIREITDNLTVADIDMKNIKQPLLPGDQVIFDAVN